MDTNFREKQLCGIEKQNPRQKEYQSIINDKTFNALRYIGYMHLISCFERL